MQEKNKLTCRLFTCLMRRTLLPGFIFPGGRMAMKNVDATLDYLTQHYGEVGGERIVAYCVCQVYAISKFKPDYLLNWKASHSFGSRACQRFVTRKQGQTFYENRWLAGNGLTREELLRSIEDTGTHPYSRFIYPEYEDKTKHRAMNTEAGYYICGASTLLWTPFSAICRICTKAEACRIRTQKLYPELYRIRIEEFNGKEAQNG